MSGYLLEQLGPDKFQELAQALILTEHKGVQCFPVGQADGGRDALSFSHRSPNEPGILFQVKYIRDPQRPDARSRVVGAIENERHKIETLLQNGSFDRYVIVTNVQGSATLQTGTIDKGDNAVAGLPVPAEVWWRDDVNRRIDTASSVRWAYPELLRATDLLQALIFRPQSSKNPLLGPLRAYIAEQAETDSEVRFKQVDLKNDLLSLFIDVPLVPSGQFKNDSDARKAYFTFAELIRSADLVSPAVATSAERYRVGYGDFPVVGAAKFLLSASVVATFPWIILEGGPGQGKSTLAQYVCQSYRLALLASSPSESQNALRLPFRVDLRELSMWLEGLDPLNDEHLAHGQPRTVEAFLASSVSQAAAGASFSIDGLLEVLQNSSSLVIFDGLDEIAELESRNKVVSELNQFARRCQTYEFNLQSVVTTRPSALTGLRPFNTKIWSSFQLSTLDEDLIHQYAVRWCDAKGIAGAPRKVLLRTLIAKLTESHIRELSRNPMQLAILLSLLHSRGVSLPDKRTALYDLYVELFFARESEKSAIVQKHLDLLVDVHRYLAWLLHSEAEMGKSLGRIEEGRLQEVLRAYLAKEGRAPAQADELFDGISQRVVFLVARVEGTFEFEVQPLREYFVGKHLYETAPYSPPGREARGTKPDRFDALARRPYWSNATRFFAGCFSKGELPGLVERLEVLSQDALLGWTNIPSSLGAALLGDWVFAQNPRSQDRIIELVVSRLSLRSLVSSSRGVSHGAPDITLPEGCGREQLIDACMKRLRESDRRDEVTDLARVVQANAEPEQLMRVWRQQVADGGAVASEVAKWISIGHRLGVVGRIDVAEMTHVVGPHSTDLEVLIALASADRWDVIQGDAEDTILEAASIGSLPLMDYSDDLLSQAIVSMNPLGYFGLGPYRREANSLEETNRQMFFLGDKKAPNADRGGKATRLGLAYNSLATRPVAEWRGSPELWHAVSREIEERYPGCWGQYMVALTSSLHCRLQAPAETGEGVTTADLILFANEARRKYRSPQWWRSAFSSAKSANERSFVTVLALLHCGPSTLVSLLPFVEGCLYGTDGAVNFERINSSLRNLRYAGGHHRGKSIDHDRLPSGIRGRTLLILASIATETSQGPLLQQLFTANRIDRAQILGYARFAIPLACAGVLPWEDVLPGVRAAYAKGEIIEMPLRINMSHDVAKQVSERFEEYPYDLLKWAQDAHARHALGMQVPLGSEAEEAQWFVEFD